VRIVSTVEKVIYAANLDDPSCLSKKRNQYNSNHVASPAGKESHGKSDVTSRHNCPLEIISSREVKKTKDAALGIASQKSVDAIEHTRRALEIGAL